MFVVTRGLAASGMSVYAAMHLLQAVRGPEQSPAWLTAAFIATALVAVALAGLNLFDDKHHIWTAAPALVALLSAGALLLSFTTGFFGITQQDLRPEVLMVLIAEAITILAFIGLQAARRMGEAAAAESVGAERAV